MYKIYLSHNLLFSESARTLVLPRFVQVLGEIGCEVYEPWKRNEQTERTQAPGWAHRVAKNDIRDIQACDGMFAILNGTPPDAGVSSEVGVAIALGKKVFLFRDDFTEVMPAEGFPVSLMFLAAYENAEDWKQHFYTSLEDIKNPSKALVQWVQCSQHSPARHQASLFRHARL